MVIEIKWQIKRVDSWVDNNIAWNMYTVTHFTIGIKIWYLHFILVNNPSTGSYATIQGHQGCPDTFPPK